MCCCVCAVVVCVLFLYVCCCCMCVVIVCCCCCMVVVLYELLLHVCCCCVLLYVCRCCMCVVVVCVLLLYLLLYVLLLLLYSIYTPNTATMPHTKINTTTSRENSSAKVCNCSCVLKEWYLLHLSKLAIKVYSYSDTGTHWTLPLENHYTGTCIAPHAKLNHILYYSGTCL